MALVAHFDFELHQMDVKMTFLNGDLEEDLYKNFLLVKVIIWCASLSSMRSSFSFEENVMDNCIYHKVSGRKICYLVLYVDEILLATDDLGTLHEVKEFLSKNFDMKDMLDYGQNIQYDWNINAAEFKKFYPLTHQGSHAFHKNRRKGKRNLPLVDRFVKPSKSASWFVRIFKGAAFLKSDHPLQVSTHEQIINDLLNASSGSSSQNEIRVFFFLSVFGWFSLF